MNLKNKMNKKGYFFLVDGIFAVVILLIGFMLISSGSKDVTNELPINNVMDNIVDVYGTVKLNELCVGCDCSIKKLSELCDDEIKNFDQTFFDYLGELYQRGKYVELEDVFHNATVEIYNSDLFGVELIIDDNSVYSDIGKDKSLHLLTTKKIIFGFHENQNNGNVMFWGPYEMQINVWQKE